jgi:hypothetical protein
VAGPLYTKDVIGISDSVLARGLQSNGRMMNCLKLKTLKRLKAKRKEEKVINPCGEMRTKICLVPLLVTDPPPLPQRNSSDGSKKDLKRNALVYRTHIV